MYNDFTKVLPSATQSGKFIIALCTITQILREIKFSEINSAKFASLTHLEALNYDLLWIFAFLES